jgi:hypothetical protein
VTEFKFSCGGWPLAGINFLVAGINFLVAGTASLHSLRTADNMDFGRGAKADGLDFYQCSIETNIKMVLFCIF